MAPELIFALFLVLANGFFVATEFAIARLRPTQVEQFERDGAPGARSVRHAVDNIDAYLAACQLGITLASLGLGAVGKPVFEELLEPVLGSASEVAGFGVATAVAFSIITLLHVVVGELSPKSLAIARTGRTALVVAPPMRLFYLSTKPLVDLFNGMGNLLLKPFGIPPAREAGHVPHTEDEIRALLRQSSAEGLIDREEQELTENVFSFANLRARDAMRPRTEVELVNADDDPANVIDRMLDTGYTRLPLTEPDRGLDQSIGVVHAKDLLRAAQGEEPPPLGELARPLPSVSDSTALEEVLRLMRREHQHMAVVVDEHGTAVGIITLEDIIEELVGEIEDEFDPGGDELIERQEGSAIVKGSAPLGLLERELGVRIEEPHEATVGGHLLELLGRAPEQGETIELDGAVAEVVDLDGPLIAAVRITSRSE